MQTGSADDHCSCMQKKILDTCPHLPSYRRLPDHRQEKHTGRSSPAYVSLQIPSRVHEYIYRCNVRRQVDPFLYAGTDRGLHMPLSVRRQREPRIEPATVRPSPDTTRNKPKLRGSRVVAGFSLRRFVMAVFHTLKIDTRVNRRTVECMYTRALS